MLNNWRNSVPHLLVLPFTHFDPDYRLAFKKKPVQQEAALTAQLCISDVWRAILREPPPPSFRWIMWINDMIHLNWWKDLRCGETLQLKHLLAMWNLFLACLREACTYAPLFSCVTLQCFSQDWRCLSDLCVLAFVLEDIFIVLLWYLDCDPQRTAFMFD